MLAYRTSDSYYHFSPLRKPTGETGTSVDSPGDYALLRRMTRQWQAEMAAKAEARTLARLRVWEDSEPSEEGMAEEAVEATAGATPEAVGEASREATREEVLERTIKGKDGGARGASSDSDDDDDDDDDDRRHGASIIDEVLPRSRGDQPKIEWRSRYGLPGGLHVRICVHRELVPGPKLREMVDRLQGEVRQGLLETRRPHEYYLARLDVLYGAAAPSEVRWEAE